MVAWAVNKCGGRRWRQLPSGLIEVEGEGTPMVKPGSDRYNDMEQTWKNWAPLLRAAAARHDLPVAWPLAIASVETGFMSHNPKLQATIVSPAGAQGVMQIMPGTAIGLGITPEQRADPAKNIDAGTKYLKQLYDGRTGHQLPTIGSAYNAGPGSGALGVRCQVGRNEWSMVADHNYPRQIIEYNNAAITYLGLGQAERGLGGYALAGAALGIGLGWATRYLARAS